MQENAPLQPDLLYRGFALFKSGKYEEAAVYFRLLTLLSPVEGRFWVTLAHTLRKTGDLAEAIDCYKAALILGQDHDPEVLLCLAEVLQDCKQEDEAKVMLKEAHKVAAPAFKKHIEFIEKNWFINSSI